MRELQQEKNSSVDLAILSTTYIKKETDLSNNISRFLVR